MGLAKIQVNQYQISNASKVFCVADNISWFVLLSNLFKIGGGLSD